MTRISEKGIEKAARALCAAEGHKDLDTLICPPFDHDNPRPRWTFYADDARAAITAYLDEVDREAPARWRDGSRPLPFDRETLGRMVREAWVRWAHTQPAPKPSWLAPYDELTETDKEADRQIGEAIARWTLIGDASRGCFAAVPEPPVSDGWRDIASAPSAKPVLVAYKNRCDKWRVVKAVRYEQYQNEQPADDDEGECGEYCEEKDAYFVRAGWYELIDNWDDFGFVSIYEGEPLFWQPLPAAPKGRESE